MAPADNETEKENGCCGGIVPQAMCGLGLAHIGCLLRLEHAEGFAQFIVISFALMTVGHVLVHLSLCVHVYVLVEKVSHLVLEIVAIHNHVV